MGQLIAPAVFEQDPFLPSGQKGDLLWSFQAFSGSVVTLLVVEVVTLVVVEVVTLVEVEVVTLVEVEVVTLGPVGEGEG